MSDKAVFRLVHAAARKRAEQACREAPDEWVVILRPPTRTLEQNALLWSLLNAIAQQLMWPVLQNGQWKVEKMSADDWKDLLSGAFEGEARRMARGISGTGLVVMGAQTSGYGKRKFSDFIEFIKAFCAEQGVITNEVSFNGMEKP